MTYEWDFAFLLHSHHVILMGLWNTLKLTCVTLTGSFVIGVIAGMGRTARRLPIRLVAGAYVEFFRNIPSMVQIFWCFYAMPILIGVQANPYVAAATALSLYGGAYCAEIYRSGIQSIERGQWEAGRAIGLGYFRLMWLVVLPQAVKRMIPAFTNQAIEIVKLTTIASTIAYAELLYSAKLVSEQESRPLESYTAIAVIFIGILLLLSYGARRVEQRFGHTD